jgi:hypothetical protein
MRGQVWKSTLSYLEEEFRSKCVFRQPFFLLLLLYFCHILSHFLSFLLSFSSPLFSFPVVLSSILFVFLSFVFYNLSLSLLSVLSVLLSCVCFLVTCIIFLLVRTLYLYPFCLCTFSPTAGSFTSFRLQAISHLFPFCIIPFRLFHFTCAASDIAVSLYFIFGETVSLHLILNLSYIG